MKAEIEPITDDEWLLRRVRVERFRSDQMPIISPNAFEPRLPNPKVRDPDLSGISLYREACLDDPARILLKVPVEKRNEFGIVRIPMSLLKELGLTAAIEPDTQSPEIPGHIVIPELRAELYVAGKASFRPFMLRLAQVASSISSAGQWFNRCLRRSINFLCVFGYEVTDE